MISKVVYFYSCFNNYELLINENYEFLLDNSDKIIIIDDHSAPEQLSKGREFCEQHGIRFVLNKYKGLQMGIHYLFSEICPAVDWLVCMQQDTKFFGGNNSILQLEERLKSVTQQSSEIGAIGFQNYLEGSHYHEDRSISSAFNKLQTWLGVFFLSKTQPSLPSDVMIKLYSMMAQSSFVAKCTRKFRHKIIFNRNFAPLTYIKFNRVAPKYRGLVSIPLPVWAVIAINREAWVASVQPDREFIFHLWFPDVAMQMMSKNFHVCLDTTVHVLNQVKIKEKYGQLGSVEEGRKKRVTKMERYGSHLRNFEKKWGFDYEWVYPMSEKIKSRYKGTLIAKHLENNPDNGPIKVFFRD